jgi:HEPN domain-containing protein
MNAKDEQVKEWLVKAWHDLLSAQRLAEGSPPLLDTAIYHCQQAGEKAVKALLVFHDIRFEKVHDIQALILLALPVEKSLSGWLSAGQALTPYATQFRYPRGPLQPPREEFDEALRLAQGMFDFVASLLPAEVRSGREEPESVSGDEDEAEHES